MTPGCGTIPAFLGPARRPLAFLEGYLSDISILHMRLILAVLLLALSTAGAIYAQITATRFRRRSRSAAWRSRSGTSCGCPTRAGCVRADQDVSPAGWARVSYVRDLPDGRRFANDSRGFLYLLDRNNQPSVYANVGAGVPVRGLQPARERVHRLRLPSGVRAERPVLHRARASARPGNPATPNFIPPGIHADGRDLPQRHHGVARDEPGGEHVRGHPARAAARGPHRRTT